MRILRCSAQINCLAAALLLALLLLTGCGAKTKPRQTVVYYEPSAEISEPVERSVPDPDTRSAPDAAPVTYVLNRASVKFHRPECAWAAKISDDSRIEWIGDRETLLEVGYRPCSACRP